MPRLWALATLAVVLSGGCSQGLDRPTAASGAATLNSERIRQQFGTYGVDVLHQDAELRVTNLYSTEPAGRVCRTLAIVSFHTPTPPELAAAHDDILAGGSIGAVLTRHGWRVVKHRLELRRIAVPADSRSASLMRLPVANQLAADLYALSAERRGVTLNYAMIAEVHHPDFMGMAQLRRLRLPKGEHPGTHRLRRLAERIASERAQP